MSKEALIVKKISNNERAFLGLVKTGLFPVHGDGIIVHDYSNVDWGDVYRLAEEQSVIGLVAAGIDWLKVHDSRLKMPQEWTLQFIGQTLQIEQRNVAMNAFVAELVEKLRKADIYTLLVKGQGVAQCYDKPLWRVSGDVDFYLNQDNYERAKSLLTPLAQSIEEEDKNRLHLGMIIDGWVVELHGTMYTKLSKKMNRVSDEVHNDIFYHGNVRSWMNKGVQIFLPSVDNDVVIIFNHFINHFYGEGVGLRQICDWCRLLYRYHGELDLRILESRIKKAGLMTEWRAFGVFAVEYLGMPEDAMLLLNDNDNHNANLKKKADKICRLIIETGNFGHNKNNTYRWEHTKLAGNFITAWRRFKEFARIATIFPLNAPKFYVAYLFNRVKANL